jgi:hypothetical protein
MATLPNKLRNGQAVKRRPLPMLTEKQRNARSCLAVADCILRLLDSLPDGDLPDPVVDAMGEVSEAAFGMVVAAKRSELGIVAEAGK